VVFVQSAQASATEMSPDIMNRDALGLQNVFRHEYCTRGGGSLRKPYANPRLKASYQ
jgi:hypothetical protein